MVKGKFKALAKNPFIRFGILFILLFFLFYGLCRAVIGFSSPSGMYNSFVADHLDFITGIKKSLIWGTSQLLYFFGIKTSVEPNFVIRFLNGRGVFIAMSCVGYGVYSFWLAYIIAGMSSVRQKIFFCICGILALWLINVGRISLLLYTINHSRAMPFGIDHHTWFNMVAYSFILLMIYFIEKKVKVKSTRV